MTEAEWLACDDPRQMLRSLGDTASDRKRRLFAAESFRNFAHLLPNVRQRRAIEMLEEIAEGTATLEARREATQGAHRAFPPSTLGQHIVGDDPYYVALMLFRALTSSSADGHAISAASGLADEAAGYRWQSCLLRELFGNPFRPVAVDPAWRTSTVLALAGGIYEERAFDRMPILADALQDAGCDHDDLLGHLRDTTATHVRGCWALDLVLGKE